MTLAPATCAVVAAAVARAAPAPEGLSCTRTATRRNGAAAGADGSALALVTTLMPGSAAVRAVAEMPTVSSARGLSALTADWIGPCWDAALPRPDISSIGACTRLATADAALTSAALAVSATTADGAEDNSRRGSPELTAAGDPDSTEAGDAGWRVSAATGPLDPVIATAAPTAIKATASTRASKPAIRGTPARP